MWIKTVGFFLVIALTVSGCASNQYTSVEQQLNRDTGKYPTTKTQFLYGRPSAFLDASDWIWPGSWLGKLFLWDSKIDSHTISEETIDYLQTYLEHNQLQDVQVLVNSYSPGNQWRRLFTNRTVGAGWRYTLGILSVSFYTILPGRFFGGDAYNPYTNTIYLYSDIPAVALHEGGHAKDTSGRKRKGTHAAIYNIPFAPLYYEARASNDTLTYLHTEEMTEEQKQAYKTLHPAYGTYVFGSIFRNTPGASLIGAIPGHISGAIAASMVEEQENNDNFNEEQPEFSQLQ